MSSPLTPSFRYPFESELAKFPADHQVTIRSILNKLLDLDGAVRNLKSQQTTASTTSSTTSSSSSSTTTGVTASQAQSIATTTAISTIQSTFNKVDNQTGTSYTVTNGDYVGIVTINNSSAVAVTLGGDGTGVNAQFGTAIENIGTGTATLTPASGTINGASSLALATNQGALVYFDGTNWWAIGCSLSGSGGTITDVIAGTGLTGGGSSGAVTLSLIDPVAVNLGGTGTSATLTGLVRGSASAMTASELSGDATTSGSNAVTLATVNPDVGSFTNANVTVNAKGLITAAANGSSSGGVSQITAGSNVTISPSGGTGNVTVNATGTAITANLSGGSLGPGQGETGTTLVAAPTTAVLMASLYDATSPGANQYLVAFAYNQNGFVGWSVFNVSQSTVTALSSTVVNIRILA
jgi:trimeric autotransporter adhesin